ncbi:hypothetical protein Tco_0051441 [Tanacetum coccineum]
METKNIIFGFCFRRNPVFTEQTAMQAKEFKQENSWNKLNAIKTNILHLSSSTTHFDYEFFRSSFSTRLCDANEGLFRSALSRNMQNLEMQFNNETLHEKDSNSELRAIKGQFEHFIHSMLFKTFPASHEQELKMTLKRLNESQVQIQECTVQKVQSSVTSSGDETSSGIVSEEEIDKKELEAHYGFMVKNPQEGTNPAESSSTDTPLEQVQNNDENNVFANERQHSEKNSAECTDERVALANLIANLTLDTEENKMILKQLKKANASLTQELKECRN